VTETARGAPGRDQLLDAALRLIGQRGVKAATVRAVADEGGVTPGLVVHHFGTKDRLAAEVDDLVLARFSAAMAVDTQAATPDDAAQAISARMSDTISTDPNLRNYVRRSILDASPAGRAIVERLVQLTTANLQQHTNATKLPTGPDLTWLALQIVTINLAGTLLEPLLEPLLHRPPFAPAEVRRRTTANLEFLTTALKRFAD
jgi:TetR/AcrR family transcriptional regulator, regulator of cefoperazone and chloramphenicol sensitivity